jgi:hypothetical protein
MTAGAQVASAAEAKPAKREGEANMRGASFDSRPGSDFTLDVIKTLSIDYVASNPASIKPAPAAKDIPLLRNF